MKKIIIIAALTVLTLSTMAQNNNALTPKQQALVAIAACEASGNIDGLKTALNDGLDHELTVSQAKEVLSQLYAYTGFPRSLNALGALQQVIKERQDAGLKTVEGNDADPLPADYNALKQGTEVQTKLTGKPFNYTFAPQTDYYLKAHLFGDIFARNNLSHAEREIVTVSAISALPGCEPQLLAHIAGALNMGVTSEQLRAIPAILEVKAGAEQAWRMRKMLAQFYGEPFNEGKPVDFNVWPKGELNSAYAKYFIGNSYLADMGGGLVNVTFEPGCRNNWHIHHKAVQMLICVAGRGWYQEWGKEPVEMVPGTVIAIPIEVKHWHGAARDSWFQHLTYMTNVQDGSSNEWLEPVTDDIYNKLK